DPPIRKARGRGFGSIVTLDLVTPSDTSARFESGEQLNNQSRPVSRPLAKPVAEEILQRPVEPNMGRGQQRAIARANRGRVAEAHDAVVYLIRVYPRTFAKYRFRIAWEFARVDCGL